MRKNKILYQLTVEDFQNVAEEILERPLTVQELSAVSERVADTIPWYELISNAVMELIPSTETPADTDH